jgi:hypothetical protein
MEIEPEMAGAEGFQSNRDFLRNYPNSLLSNTNDELHPLLPDVRFQVRLFIIS